MARAWVRQACWLAIAGSCVSLVAGPAHGQNMPSETGDSVQLEEVQVRARRDLQERFQATGSRINITRSDIEAMGANSIGDILRLTPGLQVTVTANGGLEIRMRGMGPQDTRILIDGAPASTSSRTAQLPLDELPADLIERIEVIRAPTAEHQGAAGGTINIVMRTASVKRETLIWLTDQIVWGHQAGRFFASQTGPLGPVAAPKSGTGAGNQWSYFVSLSGGHNQLGDDSIRQSTTDQLGTGLRTSALAITERSRLSSSNWTLNPRLNGRIGNNDRLTLRAVINRVENAGALISATEGMAGSTGTTPVQVQAVGPWRFERSYDVAAADWAHSFKNAKLDTTLQFERSHNDYRYDRSSTTTLGPAGASSSIVSNNSLSDVRSERATYLNSKLTAAAGERLWTTGLEHEVRHLEVTASTVTSQANAVLDFAARVRRSALWAQLEQPLEAQKTTVTFGLRAQDYALESLSAAGLLNYQHLFWQPSINSRTALSADTQLRWNLARINRSPRVWELNNLVTPTLAANTVNSPDLRGNPQLRPETTLTMDIGVDHRLKMGGQAGLNLFVRQQQDVIGRNLSFDGARWTEQPANLGQALTWGIESDIRTHLRWLGLGPDWSLRANASLLQSRMKGGPADGERIPGQARYLANLNINKPLRASGGWYGGGTLALVGPSDFNYNTSPGLLNTGSERAHAQLDLYIGSVIPNLGFWRLNVFNITDWTRDRVRTVVDNGIVYNDQSLRRMTPRWFLTVGTRF